MNLVKDFQPKTRMAYLTVLGTFGILVVVFYAGQTVGQTINEKIYNLTH